MTAGPIVRGNPITLDVLMFDGNGDPVDVTDLTASIVNALGVTVVSLDPDTVNVTTGHRQYVYAVAADAPLGAWAVQWDGTISGAPVQVVEGFTVIDAGSLVVGSSEGTTCTPWATYEDAPASITENYEIDPADVEEAFQASSDILYELTGRRYPGVCTDSIRPQAQWRSGPGLRWWASDGSSAPWGFCSCHRGRETGCATVPEIKLPGHPVRAGSVTVKINGVAFTDFALHDGRFLVRTDGEGWPCCQDMTLPDTEDRTFSIVYQFGSSPDIGGKLSAVALGLVLFVDYHPEFKSACAPPARATRVTRQGVSVDLASPKDMIDNGMTGIRVVDLWVASKFLGMKRRRATVMRPGRSRSARRTT